MTTVEKRPIAHAGVEYGEPEYIPPSHDAPPSLAAVNSLNPNALAVATDPDSISMPNPDADDAGWSYSGQCNWIVIEGARLATAAEEVL